MAKRNYETNREQGIVAALALAAVACGLLATVMARIATQTTYVATTVLIISALALLFVAGARWRLINHSRK